MELSEEFVEQVSVGGGVAVAVFAPAPIMVAGGWDRLAVPTRLGVVRGCSHPPQHLPDRAALSFTQPLRRPGDEGLSPPFDFRRLVAHVGFGPVDAAEQSHVQFLSSLGAVICAGHNPQQDAQRSTYEARWPSLR